MPQFLVAIYHPDDYDPSVENEAMIEGIHALNREMIAAGARKFAGGLSSARSAKLLRPQPDGKVLVTDGPYIETKEHIGGFWILEAADLDEAIAWGQKAVLACRASVEVRPIFFSPAPEQGPDGSKHVPQAAQNESLETTHKKQGGKVKSQYLVALYLPDDYDPSVETEATVEQIHALNREMIAAGVRKFACGLSPASSAKTLRKQPNGKVLVTDGPYVETKEHIGGISILEAADFDEILAWGRKGAGACRFPVEVRPFL
jgi:hypothetical protein